jgi:hypothetical protein
MGESSSPLNPTPVPQPVAAEPLQEEGHGPPLGFWQQPWVQNVLPFMTSLSVHAVLIILGIVTFKAYVQTHAVTQEQMIVPDAAIVAGDVGGIPNPGLDGDPNRPAASDLVPENTRSDGWNKLPSKSLQAAVLGGQGDTATDTMIGIGAGQTMGRGKGTGVGTGSGEGASAPFGVPGGGRGIGPRSPFMGVSGNAKTVAYVCDASGSMTGLPFDLLRIELKKAIDVLIPSQAFNVIFFQEAQAHSLSPTLLVANPKNKAIAFAWLTEQRERANSDPMKSLQLAFSQQPQLIYLLTDGNFEDNDAVVAEIKRLNPQKKTRVNTIAFFASDKEESGSERKACEAVLRTIAADNGGLFKVVLTDDLQR